MSISNGNRSFKIKTARCLVVRGQKQRMKINKYFFDTRNKNRPQGLRIDHWIADIQLISWCFRSSVYHSCLLPFRLWFDICQWHSLLDSILQNFSMTFRKTVVFFIHKTNSLYIYIYVWKLNQTVLELDFRAIKFLFFPRRDLNPHHWYTAAPFA